MPKKKTGAKKKADKQRERQKEIKTSSEARSLVHHPCNKLMVSIIVIEIMGCCNVILWDIVMGYCNTISIFYEKFINSNGHVSFFYIRNVTNVKGNCVIMMIIITGI